MTPSRYQKAIYKAFQLTSKDINISAVAGSGKTTVLLELLKYVPRGESALFLAFNNSIVEELRNRNTRSDAVIMTIHSCGWRSIMLTYGSKVRMNPNKAIAKTEMVIKEMGIDERRRGYYFYIVPRIVDLMRCNLCTTDREEIDRMLLHYDVNVEKRDVDIALRAFELMNRDRRQFDFMDMIYVPLVDDRVRLNKYDCVFCDESQDFSRAQQEFIRRCISRRGRLVTVGDANQAIYGFAGADADSYERLANLRGRSARMPLSVSYRCARSIVEEAQKIVPEIQPAPEAIEGRVIEQGTLKDIRRGDWVLCRNLRPLVAAYMWLLKNKIKSHIKGKDIGEGILALIIKTKAKTLPELDAALKAEKNALVEKLIRRGVRHPSYHPKMELLYQRTEVIAFLSDEVETVGELKRLIERIFTDEERGIMLSTIHKAKGLENDRVFFLCPELIPSKFANQDWQYQQEENLRYVGITRAKRELIYVRGDQFLADIQSSVNL